MIYVLDDDPAVLRAVACELADLGEVLTSDLWSDIAPQLLRAPRERGESVLVCDVNMPGSNGVDFCRIVRRHCPQVGIVIFTSEPVAFDPTVCDGVVLKSSGVAALRASVERLLKP